MIFSTTVSAKVPPDNLDAPGAVACLHLNHDISVHSLMGGFGGGGAAAAIAIRFAHDNVTFDDYRFRGSQIRPSKDAHCHVCFHDYYGGIMRRPICVYVQNGT